jgi:Flp pilus assembly protein CpaB
VRLSRRLRRVLATRPIVYWSLTLALAAGTFAVLQRATTDATDARRRWGETRSTLVATRPIAVGDVIGPANAVVRQLPVALLPAGALDTLPDPADPAASVVAAAPLAAGEIVTHARLGRGGRSPTAALLGDGHRGVAVAVPGGLPLQAGDGVDVVGAAGVVARRARVVRVSDGTAVLDVAEADAPAVARAAADGDAVVVLDG